MEITGFISTILGFRNLSMWIIILMDSSTDIMIPHSILRRTLGRRKLKLTTMAIISITMKILAYGLTTMKLLMNGANTLKMKATTTIMIIRSNKSIFQINTLR